MLMCWFVHMVVNELLISQCVDMLICQRVQYLIADMVLGQLFKVDVHELQFVAQGIGKALARHW